MADHTPQSTIEIAGSLSPSLQSAINAAVSRLEEMSKEIGFKNRDRFIQLGITISVLRKMRGMSQEQLAAEAMMSRSHLSAIEAPNIVRPFSVEVLFNIADALKVEPGDLLNTSIIPDQILNKKEK